MKKTAAYIRVSTEEQAVNGFGLDIQREKIEQYCKLHDYTNIEFYVDDGVSGWTMERPALKKLLADIENGLVERVIVYKSDRVSRHLKDLLYLIEDVFEPHGVEFVSVTEQFDTSTPQGKLFLQMLGSFAEFERNVIKERTYAGKKAKAKQASKDEIATGRVAFGYKKDGEKIVVDKEEAWIVRKIFELRNAGKSLREIANYLTETTNKKWYASSVNYILNNPKYAGKQTYRFKDEYVEREFVAILC